MTTSRKLSLVLVAACAVAATMVAPAHAVWTSGASGTPGYWAGSQSTVACVEHQGLIFHAGPSIGRTGAYRYSMQTIWIQPRLERLINGRYYVDVRLAWRSWNTYPGQVATYGRNWNQGDFVIKLSGVYRVSYDARWYVGGRLVGATIFRHHDSEINIDWGGASSGGSGQRIVSNGCTMNAGVIWVGR